jgi:sugar lactone lactonase YvrE
LSPEGEYKGYVTPEGIPSPASFVPRSFKIDSKDNIYILDIFGARVIMVGADGKYQKHIGFPKGYGFFSDLQVDFKGNIFLVDSIKNMVFSAARDAKEFSPLTKSLKEYSNFPTAITTDNRGTIYLVDENGGGIVILGQDGSFLGRQLSMGWNEGLLYYPSQICINDKDTVFIADRGNSRVQIFTIVR